METPIVVLLRSDWSPPSDRQAPSPGVRYDDHDLGDMAEVNTSYTSKPSYLSGDCFRMSPADNIEMKSLLIRLNSGIRGFAKWKKF